MKRKRESSENKTTWMMFECGGGSRWTSVSEDHDGQVCNFSGCNCGTKVVKVGQTRDREKAATWFKRPYYVVAELEKMHIATLRNLVRDDPKVNIIAKSNRLWLTKDQLIINLTNNPEIRRRFKQYLADFLQK